MERPPEDTKDPGFRLFHEDITLDEVAERRKSLKRDSRPFRARIIEAFDDAFEMVGGVPRLALYADQNYGDFLRHHAKFIPRDVDMNVKGTVTIVPALPPSRLDDPPPELVDVTPTKVEPSILQHQITVSNES